MEQFLHYIILLFISLCTSMFSGITVSGVYAFLIAIIIACISYIYGNKKLNLLSSILYFILAIWSVDFFYYIPIIVYAMLHKSILQHYLLCLLPLILPSLLHYNEKEPRYIVMTVVTFIIAYFLKRQFLANEQIKHDYILQRDNTKELAILLSEKNEYLMLEQEQEIRIATLDERNRIAREIHDNVGHLLSSSLLQIGAIQILSHDEQLKQPLAALRQTVSEGMDNVRNSVHDLHDDSLQLEVALQKLIHAFTFCPIQLEYTVLKEPNQKFIYQILPIIKECLNNTIKHSNATKVQLIFREQPRFYQMIFHDNGSKKRIQKNGLGLRNIEDRVNSLQGNLNIDNQEGFQVFITLPKEDSI